MPLDDTIAAIATAPGGAARGIVRLSGPGVADCLLSACSPEVQLAINAVTSARVFSVDIPLPELAAAPLPCEVYYWPHSRSYTRQPVAELHTLGSPPLLAALLRRLCAAGARPAQPGEFTLRAFLAGRIDLTQAEAVLGVIDARGEAELNTALSQLAGGLAAPLHQLRSDLLDLLAHLEAGLDFVEEDIEFIGAAELDAALAAAEAQVSQLAAQMSARVETQDAVRIALVGRPNAGKSSLFNSLVHAVSASSSATANSNTSLRPAAIVSHEAGTTRDYLSAQFELAGVPVELIDTAGIDASIVQDGISQAAQELTQLQQMTAHVRLVCIDASASLSDWDGAQIAAIESASQTAESSVDHASSGISLLVWTKCDHAEQLSDERMRTIREAYPTSSHTGAGISALIASLARCVVSQTAEASAPVASTVVRCSESLRQAAIALHAGRQLAQSRAGEELVAWEIRSALDGLGHVVGAIYTDDVLDRVFSRFCIGK